MTFSQGKINGYPFKRCHMKDVHPGFAGRGNPVLWFAWEKDLSDILVVGVKTKKELEAILDEQAP